MELKTKLHHFNKDFKPMLADGLIDEKGFFTEKYFALNPEASVKSTENTEEKAEGNNQSQEVAKEPTVTLTVSELEALMDKKIQEAKQSFVAEQPIAKFEAKPEKKEEFVTSLSNTDDIPELENFEYKSRRYEVLLNPKATSQGIRNRSKKNSPLMYIHPVTKQPFSLKFSSNQSSSFEEKQSNEPGSVKLRYILINDSVLFVPASDIRLQQFLHIHPDKGIIFREIDENKNAQEKIEKMDLSFKAESLVRSLDFSAQDALAKMICKTYKEGASSAVIKQDLYEAVKKHEDPEFIIKLAEDDNLLVKGLAKTAVTRGYLSYTDYRFLDSKGIVILEVGRNQDEWNAISEYLQSNQGNALREELTRQLY